jgi:hypothetical protein
MDVKYVKGMINNPDLQPNATINHWIAGILLFHFKLVHISADKHAGPDRLSCRPPAAKDPPDEDDVEDWLDDAYSFAVVLLHERLHPDLYSKNFLYTRIALPTYYSCAGKSPEAELVYSMVFALAESASQNPDSEDSAILHSQKAKARKARIQLICRFLETQERPDGMLDKEYQSFINLATHFFILNGYLWCCEPHGKHQLVVPESQQFRLIKEAHDNLGHKGVFIVQTQLLLQFWWPMLVEDVKWYVQTCHACQTRQTMKLHIPLMVPLISGLFHKVHIDTMLMPKVGGYQYIVQTRCALTSYPEWRMLCLEKWSACHLLSLKISFTGGDLYSRLLLTMVQVSFRHSNFSLSDMESNISGSRPITRKPTVS